MKIQSLAIMFIIIVLPISIVMQTYVQSRVETLSLQSQYDSKLTGATYDALKAYQLNSFNSDTSYLANSKMRDIEAGVNSFFNSLATNFSTLGYNQKTLQGYVPAVVFTMYDGYYIYSPYENTWDNETKDKHSDDTSYENGQTLYGIKPYVYYSCRYKNSSVDVVITYSMDSYVSIQGTVSGNVVSLYGYLLSKVAKSGDNVTYDEISISPENVLEENVFVDGNVNTYKYVKRNGTKYYQSNTNPNEVFSVLNGKKQVQNGFNFPSKDDAGKQYYLEAANLKDTIQNQYPALKDLKVSDAVDVNGDKFTEENSPFTKLENNGKIFDFENANGIESDTSNFNVHRIDVIKYTIERNLSVAIKNYNNFYEKGTNSTDFQMPKLKDTDWIKIIDNISIITFLQGMNVGGKIYNGYSVVTNTKNTDVVSTESIYIRNGTTYHRATEDGLAVDGNSVGVFNVDLERRTGEAENGQYIYYYPKVGTLSYDSIVTQNKVNSTIANNNQLKKIYYTALGRERYGQYREKLVLK